MVFMPNKSTPDYLFEKANQCFRRARTDSNARVELEALGNEFMVEAIDLDIKLQNLAKGNYTASSPARGGRLWTSCILTAPTIQLSSRTEQHLRVPASA